MPVIRDIVVILNLILLISLTAGCQKSQTTDLESKQESPTAEENPPVASEEKLSDLLLAIKTDEPMKAERFQAVKERFKQIGLAFQNFKDKNQYYLPTPESHPEYYDENGRLKVSWRVHLLPFLGLNKLYEQFKLDEDWDSPHNAPLAENMPDVFRSPDTPADSNKTRFRIFEGKWNRTLGNILSPNTMFPRGTPTQNKDFLDGRNNTVMVVEAGPDQAVEWTNPTGLNGYHPLEELGYTAASIPVLRADGSIMSVSKKIDEKVWKIIIGPQDRTRLNWREFTVIESMLTSEELRQFNHLKLLASAFHTYREKYGQFPLADEHLAENKPLLSWRVHLLPFVDQADLYNEFHLDESWDSPHNKTLLKKIPDIYQFDSQVELGNTQAMTFSGKLTPFAAGRGPKGRDITDGFINTIQFVVAAPDTAVPWTKPGDLPFDPENPVKALGNLTSPEFIAVIMDSSIRYVPQNIPAQELSHLIQHKDGNVINFQLRRIIPY
ncbi:DUF1559 domain-containing protein [Gimesia sp.]|uniref:DUF1559 family PulG-like putative transporter n=1 Tax=Gimesia sp. TaxID=2024833 RepID=UPI003A8E50E1